MKIVRKKSEYLDEFTQKQPASKQTLGNELAPL